MGWGKICGLCSLKAIILACFLAPATVTALPSTPAYAQFQIIIPGFGYGYQGRRYGRHSRYSRHARRGRRSHEEAGEVSAAPSGAAPSGSSSGAAPTSSGGKGVRGATD
jgi:hypothetical protein